METEHKMSALTTDKLLHNSAVILNPESGDIRKNVFACHLEQDYDYMTQINEDVHEPEEAAC